MCTCNSNDGNGPSHKPIFEVPWASLVLMVLGLLIITGIGYLGYIICTTYFPGQP